MRLIFYIFFICFLVSSCKTTQKTSTPSEATTSEHDGSSMEKAIKVTNIREEYEWVRAHYLNSQMMSQALLFNKKKPYDELTFKMTDGTTKKFYFDISSFFGKF